MGSPLGAFATAAPTRMWSGPDSGVHAATPAATPHKINCETCGRLDAHTAHREHGEPPWKVGEIDASSPDMRQASPRKTRKRPHLLNACPTLAERHRWSNLTRVGVEPSKPNMSGKAPAHAHAGRCCRRSLALPATVEAPLRHLCRWVWPSPAPALRLKPRLGRAACASAYTVRCRLNAGLRYIPMHQVTKLGPTRAVECQLVGPIAGPRQDRRLRRASPTLPCV